MADLKPIQQTEYKGMITTRRALGLPVGYCAYSLNGDLGSSNLASPMKGYSYFGNTENINQPTIRKYTYIRADGTEVMLQVRDNGTNYILEYLNIEDIRNENDGEWSVLETGLTRTRILLDGSTKKCDFGFTFFNDTGTDQLIYGNAVEGLRIWNGAVAKILSSTVNTITINGTPTISNRGFKTSGSIVINGTTYTYSGVSGTTFTGVGTNPTSEPVGSGIAQSVDSSTLSAIDKGSIFVTTNARIYMAGMTTTPQQVDYCKVGDATSWTPGTNPDDAGFEDFPDMNGRITALSNIDTWVFVFSEKRILAFSFQYPTSTSRTVIRKLIADEGCTNQKAVRKVGDKIFYITPNGGLKMIQQVAAADVFNVNDYTAEISPTIENFVWDDAVLEYDSNQNLMMMAGKSDDTKDANDMGVRVDFSLDDEAQRNVNLGLHDWFIGDMCIYNGSIHFGSSLDCQDYLAFDGWSKNGSPYIWKRIERVEIFDNPWNRKWMPFISIRGAIEPGTTLYMTLSYNVNGSLTKIPFEIKGLDSRFTIQSTLNTLGGFELGSEPLGGTLDDIGELFPFDVTYPLPNIYFKDVQLTYWTDGMGQRVIVDTHGFWVQKADQQIYATEQKEVGTTPNPIPSSP